MGYDSLNSPEADSAVKSGKVDRLQKQLNQLTKTVGNLDERLASIEALVNVAMFKQQEDIAALCVDINELKGNREYSAASSKFDMEGSAAPHPSDAPVPPPVG